MKNVNFAIFLILCVFKIADSENWCRGVIAGDCDPQTCGGVCEAKYVRFYDHAYRSDRTVKSCKCQQERLCAVLGIHTSSGCKSYATMSSAGQRYVRYWSMDRRDRDNQNTNNARFRYSDKLRHMQLMNGNSRFCCRSTSSHKRFTLQLRSSSTVYFSTICIVFTFLVTMFHV